jgi:hypothetical protein
VLTEPRADYYSDPICREVARVFYVRANLGPHISEVKDDPAGQAVCDQVIDQLYDGNAEVARQDAWAYCGDDTIARG